INVCVLLLGRLLFGTLLFIPHLMFLPVALLFAQASTFYILLSTVTAAVAFLVFLAQLARRVPPEETQQGGNAQKDQREQPGRRIAVEKVREVISQRPDDAHRPLLARPSRSRCAASA